MSLSHLFGRSENRVPYDTTQIPSFFSYNSLHHKPQNWINPHFPYPILFSLNPSTLYKSSTNKSASNLKMLRCLAHPTQPGSAASKLQLGHGTQSNAQAMSNGACFVERQIVQTSIGSTMKWDHGR